MCCSVAQEEISCKLWSSPLHTERYDWCLVSQPRLRLIPGKPSQICKRSNRVSQSSSETAKHEFSPLIHAANHSQVFISSNTFAGLTGMSHVSVHSICNNLSAVKWLRRFALHARTVGVHKRSYFFYVFFTQIGKHFECVTLVPVAGRRWPQNPLDPSTPLVIYSWFYQLITCFRPMRPAWHLQRVPYEC